MRYVVGTIRALDLIGKAVCGTEVVRSRTVDRLDDRRQQHAARERLRQDVAHPKLVRHGDRGARTPSESRGEKHYRTSMHFLDRLDTLLSTAGRRDVDDDEFRFFSVAK